MEEKKNLKDFNGDTRAYMMYIRRQLRKRNNIGMTFEEWSKTPAYKRYSLQRALKDKILERDEHRCVYCGKERNLVIDHIIAVSKGGAQSSQANLQVLCSTCNRFKYNN